MERAEFISSLSEPNKVTVLFIDYPASAGRSWGKTVERMVNSIRGNLVVYKTVNADDEVAQDALGLAEPPVVIIADNGEEIREFLGHGSAADLAEIKSVILPLID